MKNPCSQDQKPKSFNQGVVLGLDSRLDPQHIDIKLFNRFKNQKRDLNKKKSNVLIFDINIKEVWAK